MAGLAARELLKTKGRSELSKALGQRRSDTVGDQLHEGEDQSRWELKKGKDRKREGRQDLNLLPLNCGEIADMINDMYIDFNTVNHL